MDRCWLLFLTSIWSFLVAMMICIPTISIDFLFPYVLTNRVWCVCVFVCMCLCACTYVCMHQRLNQNFTHEIDTLPLICIFNQFVWMMVVLPGASRYFIGVSICISLPTKDAERFFHILPGDKLYSLF